MKKNIIALEVHCKDGDIYLYGDWDFYVGDRKSEVLAWKCALWKAKAYLEKDYVESVNYCYVDAEWNFEVKESKIYKKHRVIPNIARDIPYDIGIIAKGITLEILPDACYNFPLKMKLGKLRKRGLCIDWKSQNPNIEWDNNSWWYLHGELQDEVGFDKACILNATAAGVTEDSIKWREIYCGICTEYKDIPFKRMRFNGIRKCNVIGVDEDCIGFFWTSNRPPVKYDKGTFDFWDQRGLVVKRHDIPGMLFAYHKYLMKHSSI